MQNNDIIFWHAFSSIGGFGAQRFKKLFFRFGNLENAWQASQEALVSSGIGEKHIEDLLDFRKNNSPEKLFENLEKENIGIITMNDRLYPSQLGEIPSAPAVLYGRGNFEILKNKFLAVVGSRKFTA